MAVQSQAPIYTVHMNSILEQGKPVALTTSALRLPLLLLGSARAGFPSPAEDLQEHSIDLIEVLVTHPQATYVIRARGDSMVEAGIFDNSLLVVDRALKPRNQDIVLAQLDGEYTIKYFYQRAGITKLKAANPTYPDIVPKEGQTLQVWGVVTACIKQFRS